MKEYIVLRLFYRGSSESHSIEYKDTLREAETRFHNVLAADEGNSETTYCLCMVFDKYSNVIRSEMHDYRDEKTIFYPLVRIYEKNGNMNNSVQIFEDIPNEPGKAFTDAEKRWYAVIATDLNDAEVTYNAAIMMDNNMLIDRYHKAFENPIPEPEPTPEPEPEPETET